MKKAAKKAVKRVTKKATKKVAKKATKKVAKKATKKVAKKATKKAAAIGEYCIVRTYSAGVFAGFIDTSIKGKENIVYDARRIWYWDGAASLSQLAIDGTSKPENCKFPEKVDKVILKEIIEIIPCTEKAKASIESVKVWKK
jgi:hypothetical protein